MKLVVIQKVNEHTIGGSELDYIYFISPIQQDDKNGSILNLSRNEPYILQEGEYFIWTNAQKTTLEILISGTRVEYIPTSSTNSESITLTFPKIDISNINRNGLSAITDEWVAVTNPVQFKVTEESFINAGAGDVLSFSYDSQQINNTVPATFILNETVSNNLPPTSQTPINPPTITSTSLKSFSVPIRPRRCDHFRIRIVGKGPGKIYSITKTLEIGSDM